MKTHIVKIILLFVVGYIGWMVLPPLLFQATAEADNGIQASNNASDPAYKNNHATVVELFTSQGCYSCPPAESYLRELSQRPDVITLELHVDYWDDLNYGLFGKWKDKFSSPANTARQADYNNVIRGKPNAYTPQMVIDGHLEVVGSRQSSVEKLISKAQKTRTRDINLTPVLTTPNHIDIKIEGLIPDNSKLTMVRFLKRKTTNVTSGENKGKTLTSYNAATELIFLPSFQGKGTVQTDIRQAFTEDQGCAVLLQDRKTHRILNAAFCHINTDIFKES